ncbi:dihydropteroate synthase [Haloarchaeobius amylolyticus]|uniref:dihydropteroate synthase n=1 Tax=Haloarchaeobius amylolyticus TaxID=1198296 RepID=UPI0022702EED|nr:dihydropteroate synthase [Haloarchaeobius amylolyticus]
MRDVDAAGLGIGDGYPTRVMGVLNVSSESPYKPSVFDDAGDAAAYVDEELIGEGADIVDVGLESANKKFDVLSAEQELDRLDVALETIESTSGDAVWSIETRYHEVAEAAIEGGFDMVNDIAGFADPEMPRVCEEYDVAVGKMASPPDLTRPGAVEETPWAERKGAEWAESADYVDQVYEALKQHGLTDKTIVDPAFGGWSEAQTTEQDRETLRRLREFRGLGQPILVSINRKNFLRELTGRDTEQALAVSLAATSMAIERGAHVVRTHDVRETVDACAVGDAFTPDRLRGGSGDVTVEELDVQTEDDVARHVERLDTDDVAADATRAVLEVSGLTTAQAESLAAAASDAGAVFATGAGDGRGGLLVGSYRCLRRLAATAPEDGELSAVTDEVESLVG